MVAAPPFPPLPSLVWEEPSAPFHHSGLEGSAAESVGSRGVAAQTFQGSQGFQGVLA
jgi:hypothetical protein